MPEGDAYRVLSALVLENGKRWGEIAADWQTEDAKAILDGKIRRHYLTRPRGGSKTSDLAGVVIALMLGAPKSSRSYGLAGDKEQAGLLLDAIAGFVGRTPEVRGALEVENWKVRNPKTDASFQIVSSDEASAWGWKPWLIIIDELANWPQTRGPQRLLRAAISSLPKVPDSRMVVLTSAGDPGHFSHKFLTQATGDEAWRVNQVEGPVPWISDKDIEEQKRLLPAWEFERLIMNRWQAADDKLTTIEHVNKCIVLDGPQLPRPRIKYVIGLDIGLVNDATVATVCHMTDNTVHLDQQEVWKGSRDNPVSFAVLERWLVEAHHSYNRAPIVYDPSEAANLMQRLDRQRVPTIRYTFSQSSVARLALNLHRLITSGQLAIYDDDGLIDELLNVRLEERGPGNYRIDHASGAHDDRVISLALAAHHLVGKTKKKPTSLAGVDLTGGLGYGRTTRDPAARRSWIGFTDIR